MIFSFSLSPNLCSADIVSGKIPLFMAEFVKRTPLLFIAQAWDRLEVIVLAVQVACLVLV